MNYETSLREPVEVEIENKTGIKQTFRYYLCNFTEVMEPDDVIKLTVTSSETLAYYTKIKDELAQAGEGGGVLEPIDIAKIIYAGLPITDFTLASETEECTRYTFMVEKEGSIRQADLNIYAEERYADPESLDDGVGGNYNVESTYNSTQITYATTQGAIIGHTHIEL